VGLLLLAQCAAPKGPASAPDLTLPDAEGRPHRLVEGAAKLTVIEFFSAHCPCQTRHDERLRAIAEGYAPRGVRMVAVDSEIGAGAARARDEGERRRYPFPILIDPDGAAANALDAKYATYALVVDGEGRVLYAGGIDSDKYHLTDDATPFLREALDDALADRPVRRPVGKTLGCALTLK
jgi:peroxiredoxin